LKTLHANTFINLIEMFYKFLKFKILWIRKDLKKMTKKIQKNDLIKKEKNVLK
jgi:hypothetical protein